MRLSVCVLKVRPHTTVRKYYMKKKIACRRIRRYWNKNYKRMNVKVYTWLTSFTYDICHVQYAHMRCMYTLHVTREYIYWKSEKERLEKNLSSNTKIRAQITYTSLFWHDLCNCTEENVYSIQVNIIYFKYIINSQALNLIEYILNFSKCSILVKNIKLKQKFGLLTT